MRLEHLVDQVDPAWRSDFVRFIDTGEASDEFLAYLDSNASCQQAVEEAFAAQTAAFEEFAKLLQSPEHLAAAVSAPSPEEVANGLSMSLLEAAGLSGYQQHEVVERVGKFIRSSRSSEKLEKTATLVADLERTIVDR